MECLDDDTISNYVEGTLAAADVATALARIEAYRRRRPARPRSTTLRWPAHARLAKRLTAG